MSVYLRSPEKTLLKVLVCVDCCLIRCQKPSLSIFLKVKMTYMTVYLNEVKEHAAQFFLRSYLQLERQWLI